ncbi:hypothetical protein ADL27_35495 [Streptomyces sp. NRRL F-6602]|nr:hypothetical protein ADL27_35495 [Streptomyces sp. NRRL F-6602]
MKTLLNIIWLVLSGFWLFLAYMVAGVLLCITIIGIPFGVAAFRIGVYALWPSPPPCVSWKPVRNGCRCPRNRASRRPAT